MTYMGAIPPGSSVAIQLNAAATNQHSGILNANIGPAIGQSTSYSAPASPAGFAKLPLIKAGADGLLQIEADFSGSDTGDLIIYVNGAQVDAANTKVSADTWRTYVVSA